MRCIISNPSNDSRPFLYVVGDVSSLRKLRYLANKICLLAAFQNARLLNTAPRHDRGGSEALD
jgi:hypothetical protein